MERVEGKKKAIFFPASSHNFPRAPLDPDSSSSLGLSKHHYSFHSYDLDASLLILYKLKSLENIHFVDTDFKRLCLEITLEIA